MPWMECIPTAKVLVVSCAVPLDSATVPRIVVPSLKTTLPVGVPTLALAVAVNVTGFSFVLGDPDVMITVAVAALFTVCVKVEELGAYFGVPP